MIGFIDYQNYIITFECIDYESVDKNIINSDYATYETNRFKVIRIEDVNGKEYGISQKYELNTFYDNKICFKINKECIIYDIINKLRIYKSIFMNFFPNGISGICKLYHNNGVLKEEYFHNNGVIEGDYITYYDNGKILEKS